MNLPEGDGRDSADMERVAQGEDKALNDLMDRHGERLYHYLIRQVGDETEAGDLTQESFVRIYQNRAKFRREQKFSTWLYAIATNLARDRRRWRGRHPTVSLDGEDEASAFGQGGRTPSEELQSQEQAEAVKGAIAELPEDLRTPLILAEYEERSQAEIAEILGCTVKAVETRIYRARKQLRARLEHLLR